MANDGEDSSASTQNTPPPVTALKKDPTSRDPKMEESKVTFLGQTEGQIGIKNQSNTGNPLGSFCSVKLKHENYLLWKSMVLPVIRGNRLEGLITGAKSCPPEFLTTSIENSTDVEVRLNPDYENWVTQDQILLGWLYNSIDVEVASEVMGNETSKDLWDALKTLFGVQNRANVVFFKKEFRRMQKGGLKMSEYLKAMKKIADNLSLAGKPVDDDDLVSQVLAGLDSLEYNPVVCQLNEKEHVSWMELQSTLLSYERRLEQINGGLSSMSIGQASANFATNKSSYQNKGHNQNSYQSNNNGHNSNRSSGGNNYRGRGGRFGGRSGRSGGNTRPICQVCGKMGHTAAHCYFRFDNNYMGTPPDQSKNNQQSNYYQHSAYITSPEMVCDSAWYADSGASSHVTGDSNNLTQKSDFHGQANGSGAAQREA